MAPEQTNGNDAALAPHTGQFGHLTPEQEKTFADFKAVCEKEDVFSESNEGRSVGRTKRERLDDAALLRFLRARKFEVPGALKQLKDTELWRDTNRLDELYDGFDVDAFEEARKVYHQWTGRRDRSGHPVYVYEISHIKDNIAAFDRSSKIVSTNNTASATDPIPGKLRMLCALYENMAEFVLPLCNAVPGRPNPETPVTATSHIVDVSGMGLMGYWNLKSHMQAASVLASTYYPETLDRVFLIGAPSFFPTVWSWIKRWFDPATTAKLFVLSASEVTPTLTRFMRPEDLPKKYGGELDWGYGMAPSLDTELAALLKRPAAEGGGEGGNGLEKGKWVRGPLRWVPDTDGARGAKIVARGTVGGKPRDEVVGVFTPRKA
ncbi:CRAL-TRIO domain-containing protein [Mycena sanguinolenta]|uniref:CRAL-TRIO domain-containing protein n=1 Tax=Mycena sanguinolenta TaxID=230812 RepID=A0A8H6YHV2_9AGAR|nr:CRAL-TRIO domain-containing protein [Mycena sanguinolenta]